MLVGKMSVANVSRCLMVSFPSVSHVTFLFLLSLLAGNSLFMAGLYRNKFVHSELVGGNSNSIVSVGSVVLVRDDGVAVICALELRSGLDFAFGLYWCTVLAPWISTVGRLLSVGMRWGPVTMTGRAKSLTKTGARGSECGLQK